ncbi:hypothetical protein GCM10009660_13480 [Catellatospora bangladeshensis]
MPGGGTGTGRAIAGELWRARRRDHGPAGRGAGVPAEQVGARAVAFDAASPLAVAFDAVSSSTVDVVSVDLPSTVDVSVDNAGVAVGGVGLRSG